VNRMDQTTKATKAIPTHPAIIVLPPLEREAGGFARSTFGLPRQVLLRTRLIPHLVFERFGCDPDGF
jgi:hypothetical protein